MTGPEPEQQESPPEAQEPEEDREEDARTVDPEELREGIELEIRKVHRLVVEDGGFQFSQ